MPNTQDERQPRLQVELSGVTLSTFVRALNFVGAGVTVTVTDRVAEITISGGGGGGTATEYAEDTASVAGDMVTLAGVVRSDTPTTKVGADNDRTFLLVDADGKLWVRERAPGTLGPAAKVQVDTGAGTSVSAAAATKVGVYLQADRTNPGTIYVGDSAVDTDGFGELVAGETMYIATRAAVYCASSDDGQFVRVLPEFV